MKLQQATFRLKAGCFFDSRKIGAGSDTTRTDLKTDLKNFFSKKILKIIFFHADINIGVYVSAIYYHPQGCGKKYAGGSRFKEEVE